MHATRRFATRLSLVFGLFALEVLTSGSLWANPSGTVSDQAETPAESPSQPEAAPPAPAKPPTAPKRDANGHLEIEFTLLAGFPFEVPTDPAQRKDGDTTRIPAHVRDLHNQNVRIRGFVMPLTLNADGRVESCVVVRNTMICCYGVTPEPNEWIVVTFREPVARMQENVPLFFYGRLSVGETYEHGEFAGMYRLECVAASPRPLRTIK